MTSYYSLMKGTARAHAESYGVGVERGRSRIFKGDSVVVCLSFLTNSPPDPSTMFRADEGDGASLRQLCSQTECLRTRLRERLDNGDLSSAIKIAERSVGKNCIVALLAMVQCKSLKVLIVLSLRSKTHNPFHSRCG